MLRILLNILILALRSMPDDSLSDVEPSTDSDTPPVPSAPLAPPPRVVKIHLDRPCRVQSILLTGLSRTKPDYLTERIRGLLDVSNYHELLEEVAETRAAIGSMGIFKNVTLIGNNLYSQLPLYRSPRDLYIPSI